MLAGTVRLALLMDVPSLPVEEVDSLYAGTVVETSPRIKVVRLSSPASLSNVPVAFATSADLETGDYVHMMGRLREFNPSGQGSPRRLWQMAQKAGGN